MTRFVRIQWPRLLGSAILLLVLFGNQGFRGLVRNWVELGRLRREIVSLEHQEGAESGRLKAVRSGGAPFERLARKELGYIRKGEIEYRFPPPVEEKN
ncbi:MAG: septum formation initiator family protein [Elusimicrobia bacterium]|nr:septum formation initiator family protein [Elusimicrobiota bacterium]